MALAVEFSSYDHQIYHGASHGRVLDQIHDIGRIPFDERPTLWFNVPWDFGDEANFLHIRLCSWKSIDYKRILAKAGDLWLLEGFVVLPEPVAGKYVELAYDTNRRRGGLSFVPIPETYIPQDPERPEGSNRLYAADHHP